LKDFVIRESLKTCCLAQDNAKSTRIVIDLHVCPFARCRLWKITNGMITEHFILKTFLVCLMSLKNKVFLW